MSHFSTHVSHVAESATASKRPGKEVAVPVMVFDEHVYFDSETRVWKEHRWRDVDVNASLFGSQVVRNTCFFAVFTSLSKVDNPQKTHKCTRCALHTPVVVLWRVPWSQIGISFSSYPMLGGVIKNHRQLELWNNMWFCLKPRCRVPLPVST